MPVAADVSSIDNESWVMFSSDAVVVNKGGAARMRTEAI